MLNLNQGQGTHDISHEGVNNRYLNTCAHKECIYYKHASPHREDADGSLRQIIRKFIREMY